MQKTEIIKEIENRVNRTEGKKYSIWTVGITNNPERRKGEHDDKKSIKYWRDWKANSESDAREIEKHF
ncbi:hypothetical protein KAH94_06330, partial [bacterium]|nr:hypothetical protein [bacterium]